MTQRSFEIKGLYHHESFSLIPTAASTKAGFATAAIENWELRHIDVEQAYLEANIDEDIYVELPEEYRTLPNAAGLLRKAIHGLVELGFVLFWKVNRPHQREEIRTVSFRSMSVQEIHRR